MKQDKQLKTRPFGNWNDAKEFAHSHRGFVEGPFFDDNLSKKYIVFYK